MKAPDNIKGTTPKGIAKFPRLSEPDTKFITNPTDLGKYSVKILMKPEAAQKIMDEIDALYDENLAFQCEANNKKPDKIKQADKPYRMEEDRDTGEETGMVEMTFSMNAGGISKKTNKPWSQRPDIFDRYGKPLKSEVGGGSTIQVAYELSPYYTGALGAGISLRLVAVMVHDLKQWGSNDPEALGFDIEEAEEAENDGFETVAQSSDGDY